jgi:hypothetical protein
MCEKLSDKKRSCHNRVYLQPNFFEVWLNANVLGSPCGMHGKMPNILQWALLELPITVVCFSKINKGREGRFLTKKKLLSQFGRTTFSALNNVKWNRRLQIRFKYPSTSLDDKFLAPYVSIWLDAILTENSSPCWMLRHILYPKPGTSLTKLQASRLLQDVVASGTTRDLTLESNNDL